MDNFDLRKYLAEGKLLKENKYDIDDPNSPLGQLNDNDQDVAILNNMTKKYGKDVVLMWMSSGEYGDREYFEEGKLLKEDITKLRGQELLDFFSYTKYMDVNVKKLEEEFIDSINYGYFTDPTNVEEDKKEFTSENGDKFLETNEDKMSEYLGFEIDTEQMLDDYFIGNPKGVEFVHSDKDFERWMAEGSEFWR